MFESHSIKPSEVVWNVCFCNQENLHFLKSDFDWAFSDYNAWYFMIFDKEFYSNFHYFSIINHLGEREPGQTFNHKLAEYWNFTIWHSEFLLISSL